MQHIYSVRLFVLTIQELAQPTPVSAPANQTITKCAHGKGIGATSTGNSISELP